MQLERPPRLDPWRKVPRLANLLANGLRFLGNERAPQVRAGGAAPPPAQQPARGSKCALGSFFPLPHLLLLLANDKGFILGN